MSKGIPTGKQLLSGKQAWLNPKDWGSGKLQASLTGDRDKDMQSNLAKYGLHAAAWAPALLYESGKKGSEMRAQASADASAQKQADQFNAIQPSQNDVQFQGQNPYLSGPYNQTAGLLGGQSANAMPGQNPGIPQGQMGMPQGGQMQMGGLSPNTMNPQLQQWLMQNMNQANAGQMGGLL